MLTKITIYGSSDCEKCGRAVVAFGGEAEYKNHDTIYDDFGSDVGPDIATATGGSLPIIVVQGVHGMIVLGMGNFEQPGNCADGACSIGGNGTIDEALAGGEE